MSYPCAELLRVAKWVDRLFWTFLVGRSFELNRHGWQLATNYLKKRNYLEGNVNFFLQLSAVCAGVSAIFLIVIMCSYLIYLAKIIIIGKVRE